MELRDALRTTGSIRAFATRPVPDDVLYEVLDDARFAPSGGNRQAWRVLVIKDPTQRNLVANAYLDAWHDYVGHVLAGLTPFSPLASAEDRERASEQRAAAMDISKPDGFAETMASVPAMLVVLADLAAFAATDRDLDRYHMVGGASVYPFVWSVLLAARERGLGGVITTVATAREPELRQVLGLPDSFAIASVVALGYPEHRATKLKRRLVEEFTAVDRFDGPPFRV